MDNEAQFMFNAILTIGLFFGTAAFVGDWIENKIKKDQ